MLKNMKFTWIFFCNTYYAECKIIKLNIVSNWPLHQFFRHPRMERDHAPPCVAHVISTAVCKLQAEKLRDLCMILPKKSGAQEKIFIMWLLVLTSLVGRVGADAAYAALRAKKVSNNFLHGAIKRESVAIFHYFSIPPKPRHSPPSLSPTCGPKPTTGPTQTALYGFSRYDHPVFVHRTRRGDSDDPVTWRLAGPTWR
jgi:hypothetical protein